MKLCVAQTRPARGDIGANTDSHIGFVEAAIQYGAELIIFPELSLTGYESELAAELAIERDDERLEPFQALADSGDIAIALGAPTKTDGKPHISLIVFRPNRAREIYSKRYLHPGEEAFFDAGQNRDIALETDRRTALAICYEISVAQHAEDACAGGAEVYAASVVMFATGIEHACNRMPEIARNHSMVSAMSNCVGLADGRECAGRSSIWSSNGSLVAQLDDKNQGWILFDTNSGEAVVKYL